MRVKAGKADRERRGVLVVEMEVFLWACWSEFGGEGRLCGWGEGEERTCSGDFEVGEPGSQVGCLLQTWGSRLNASCLLFTQYSSDLGRQLLISFFFFVKKIEKAIPPVNWKKMHNLKAENDVLFGGLTEDYSLGDSLSALRNCSKEIREGPGYIGWKTKNKNQKTPT